MMNQIVAIGKNHSLKGLIAKSLLTAIALGVLAIALHFLYRPSLITLFILLFISERVYESYFLTNRGADDLERDRYLTNIVIAFTGMVLGAILEFYLIRRPLIPAWTIGGIVLLAISGILRWSSIKVVGEAWSIETFAVPVVIERNGPYRYFRHPYYLGVFLEAISFPLILNAWYALIFSVSVVAPLEAYRALLEEHILVKKFGWFYIRFKKEINRFLPTIIRRKVYDRRMRSFLDISQDRRNNERRSSEKKILGKDRRRIIVGNRE